MFGMRGAVILGLLTLLGCSSGGPSINGITGNATTLVVGNLRAGDTVALFSGSRQSVGQAVVGRDGTAQFAFSERQAAQVFGQCLTAVPMSRAARLRSVEDLVWFRNPAWADRQRARAQMARMQARLGAAQRSYAQARQWLSANPATYRGGVCTRPARPTSPMPQGACAPAGREDYAIEACGAAAGACQGLGLLGDSLGGPLGGLLASQGCAAATSRQLSVPYDFDTILSTLATDIALEQFKQALEKNKTLEGGFWATAAGATVARSIRQCSRAVSQQCSAQYRRWSGEPDRLLAECQRHDAALRGGPPEAPLPADQQRLLAQANATELRQVEACTGP